MNASNLNRMHPTSIDWLDVLDVNKVAYLQQFSNGERGGAGHRGARTLELRNHALVQGSYVYHAQH
jgi:hypothetical protein